MQREKLRSALNKIQFILLISFLLSLPFTVNFNSLLIILIVVNFSVIAASQIKDNKAELHKRVLSVTVIFGSLFLLYLLAFIFSGDFKNWYIIEKKFSIFFFPIVLGTGLYKIDKKQGIILLFCFIVSNFLASILTFKNNYSLFFKHSIDIQVNLIIFRPYFGLYCIFSVFISIYLLFACKNFTLRVALAFLCFYFIYFTYLIYAKMAIIGFIVAGFSVIVLILLVKRLFKKLIILSILTITSLAGLVSLNPTTQEIFLKIIKFEPFNLRGDQWIYFLSMNTRYTIWDCNWSLLMKDSNWLWGTGLDHQQALSECYSLTWNRYGVNTSDGIEPSFLEDTVFNAHNEFLQVWMDLGVFGFAAIVILIVISIQIAIRQRNYLYFAFLILFYLCCLSESMLARQKGIVFFAFFNSFLAFNLNSVPETTQRTTKSTKENN